MKRLFVLGFAVMALGTSAFAQSETKLVEKLSESATIQRVVEYAEVGYDQRADMKYILAETAKRYEKALRKGMSENEAVTQALNFNLANAKAVLTDYQYRKFLQVLNAINNETNTSFYAAK